MNLSELNIDLSWEQEHKQMLNTKALENFEVQHYAAMKVLKKKWGR